MLLSMMFSSRNYFLKEKNSLLILILVAANFESKLFVFESAQAEVLTQVFKAVVV